MFSKSYAIKVSPVNFPISMALVRNKVKGDRTKEKNETEYDINEYIIVEFTNVSPKRVSLFFLPLGEKQQHREG